MSGASLVTGFVGPDIRVPGSGGPGHNPPVTTDDQQAPARTRTHHVALVHDGTVWSEDGALPTFVHADEDDGDPTRTATRHVADGVHAAPPIPLPQPPTSPSGPTSSTSWR